MPQDWIIFVPGFAGSHLHRIDPGGDRRVKIWLSQANIGWNGIGELDTAGDVSPAVLERVEPGIPIEEVYRPFTSVVLKAGWILKYAGYDWRTDCLTNGQRLAAALEEEVNSDATFTIVTHSAGGLVAAAAMSQLSPAAAAKVARVVTCACPWSGAFTTLQLFHGRHELVQAIVRLNSVFSRRSLGAWLAEALRVVCTWPGAYDLLPMPELMDAYPPAPGTDFRTDGIIQATSPHFDPLEYTAAVARRPVSAPLPVAIQWHNVRGVGRDTWGPSPTVEDGRPSFWPSALDGDGTVPKASSAAPAIFNAIDYFVEAGHDQFMSAIGTLRVLDRLMGFGL